MITRRSALALAAGGSLAAPALSQPAGRVLRFVPTSDLSSLDPVWTTANVVRHHGFMIYDTLFGLDDTFQPTPQMAEGYTVDDEGRRCVITLRKGLAFHDGTPVLARDVVASLRRWMRRNSGGQFIAANLDELSATDDSRLEFRLRRPQPRLIALLASITAPVAFIMPEAVAATDPFTQIRSVNGSGPFRLRPDEFSAGNRVVYERNQTYVPSPGPGGELTSGPKLARFDRIEWRIIPDPATAAAALQTGEVDWYEAPPPELLEMLTRNRGFRVEAMDRRPAPAVLRFNHLHPPFNDKALRQAILPALDQRDFMEACVGDNPADYVAECGFFTPGTPLANDAGLGALTKPRSLDAARALVRAASGATLRMRVLHPTDSPASGAIALVGADLFKRMGFDVDLVSADWSTVVQRRASREPLEAGGWSVFPTTVNAPDFVDPAIHFALRGNGRDAWLGWPSSPRIETLRDEWFAAVDLPAQQALARQIQDVAFDEMPYIPVGAYRSRTALKQGLQGRVTGFPIFWNLQAA